ncbi:MAG TPA: OB-fold nucleic acid binding domain-containing protein, partial [Myxococcales bacterium]|nr:OB-fold nucleic acid binding domain-containing protein [Myxococcales bacterium]
MSKEQEIYEERLAKAKRWRELGANPWGNGHRPQHLAADILRTHEKDAPEALEQSRPRYAVAGRVVALRSFGKAAFIQLQDRKGRLQLYVKKDAVGDEAFATFESFDIGDIIGASGWPFRTKTGELSLHVTGIRLLTK